jgi:hypothetical protein
MTGPDPDDLPPPPRVSDGWMLLGYLGVFALAWLSFRTSPAVLVVMLPLAWAARRRGTIWRKVGLGMAAALGFVMVVFGACVSLAGVGRLFR